MKNIKTLLIEDNPDDIELLKDLFSEANCSLAGFAHVDGLSAGLEILDHNNFEIVLLDISLPDSYGPDMFYKLHDKIPETPIIIITGNRDKALIGNLLQNGVAELRVVKITWKNKPAYLASVRNVTEQKQLRDEMKRLSFRDNLTGLYNRAYFEEEAKRLDTDRNLPLCLIVGDVNNLKLANDTLGHSEGDRLLIDIAQILKKSCRKEDIVVRFGGDEFVILLTKCDDKTAARIISNIKVFCKNIVLDNIPVSIALGAAVKNKPGKPISNFLDIAGERMYANKLTESNSRYGSFISSLEMSLYEKDYITMEHAFRVRDLCIQFGTELKLNDSIIDELTVLASLHDIGKITIPASILNKDGPLTDEEWEIIKQHPETGYRITKVIHGMGFIAEDILCHHERWDGKGYPQGRTGEQIPMASRILSVIDTFDVITHERPYKEAFSEQEALSEIKRCSGSQFDPQIAEAFVTYFEHSVLKSCV